MKEWILYTSSLMVCISLQSVWSTALWVPPVWMIVLFFVATRKAFYKALCLAMWRVFFGVFLRALILVWLVQ